MNKEFSVPRINRYSVRGLSDIETPRPLFFEWAIEKNRDRLESICQGFSNLRLMAKTFKSSRILDYYTRKGLTSIKASGINEARALAGKPEIKDILVAFPCFGPSIDNFLKLRDEFPGKNFSVICDDFNSAEEFSSKANHPVDVFIDIDPGMKRTGIPFDGEIVSFAEKISKLPNIRIIGLHAYDGSIHHPNPCAVSTYSENFIDSIDRTVSSLKNITDIKEVVTSSSLTAESNLKARREKKCAWKHTVSPGTAVLWDSNYNDIAPGAFDYAFAVATRILKVIPYRDTHILTTDSGVKFGVGTDCGAPHVFAFKGYKYFGCSERFGRLLALGSDRATGDKVDEDIAHAAGKVVLIFPRHVCTTLNQYNYGFLVKENEISEKIEMEGRDG